MPSRLFFPLGLILKANKKYSQTVQKAFHLSQAALDLSKSSDDDVQVMLTSEDNTYLLCTLGKKTPQVALDLNFDEGDHISLSTKGEGIVHLTGYLVPIEDDLFDNFEDDLEAEEEEVEVEVPQQKGKVGKQVSYLLVEHANVRFSEHVSHAFFSSFFIRNVWLRRSPSK